MTVKIAPSLETLVAHGSTPIGIAEALQKSNGSKFYRCAFQVNPFEYCKRHSKGSVYSSENEYNDAMARACREQGIEIIGITDHFRYDASVSLAERLRAEGITVFPGFEANSSEGVHILCLFSPGTSVSDMNALIGACDIRDPLVESPISNKSCEQILELVQKRGGVAISAHVTQSSGLLKTLRGTARANAWKSEYHHAAAIPGPVETVPPELLQICKNKEHDYRRSRPIAFVNASDISNPEDFAKDSASCLVKMTDISIEGLKQAFLDPGGRVLLNSDNVPSEYTRIVAVSWDRGLLSGQSVALNAGLNVLIGGRGAGKSTIIESLRYVFDMKPSGKQAEVTHKAMMKELVGQRASISVLVYSPSPSPGYYLVERTYGQDPRVKNQHGELIQDLRPLDLIPGLEVYGQHEISELTRDRTKLAEVLERFVGHDQRRSVELDGIRARLRESRNGIIEKQNKIDVLKEALAALPGLIEKLKRFKETGIPDLTKEMTAVKAEERLLEDVSIKLADFNGLQIELRPTMMEATKSVLPLDGDQTLPNHETLKPLQGIFPELDEVRRAAADLLAAAHEKAIDDFNSIKSAWLPLRAAAAARYDAVKAELEREGYDPEEYLNLEDQIARLTRKKSEKENLEQELADLRFIRKKIIEEWEAADRRAYNELEVAAKKVSRKLSGVVKAVLLPSSSLEPLEEIIRLHVEGHLAQPLAKLADIEALSLSDLANNIRSGSVTLVEKYGFSDVSARKIADAGEALALEVEECRIPPEALIELNVGRDRAENWKRLENLSAGQKATAVLLLLLLDADAPLIIDQPEDDLDNQFIAGRVVPLMRDAKKCRQFIFSSHNPNIPVLGDADQIIGLTATVEEGEDRTKISEENCGSIDKVSVQQLIKELLEGGEQAFTTRRAKYGF
ncbi:TrlF family AAA-like ATPase [Thalassospira xiamenensis]|uniref:PHP domain-containing protein n=1 Tax=Thalassospira xiamenensis TaxID=220697 RepID=A0A285TXW2_9PROT|nr:AAA family ATPase [Thalassospira xiamenensis]SOC30567.1 PHP domain-containing protein [Thalassospira xiamenensis]